MPNVHLFNAPCLKTLLLAMIWTLYSINSIASTPTPAAGLSPAVYSDLKPQYVSTLAAHPSVQSLQSSAAAHRALATKALSLPDPQLVIGLENLPISNPSFDRFLPTSKTLGFSQAIPNKAGRQAQSQMQTALATTQNLIKDYQLQKLIAEFLTAKTDYWAISEQEKLLKQQLHFFQIIEDDYKGQLAAGRASFGQLSLVDLEKASLELELSQLGSKKISSSQTLISLVGEIPDTAKPNVTLTPWNQTHHELYPLLIASSVQSQAKATLAQADAAFKPNYAVTALYKQRESSTAFEGDDWVSLQATISLPLWSSSSQTPNKAAALSRINESAFDYEALHKDLVAKMLSLQADHKSTLESVLLLQKKKRAIDRIIETARGEYEAGNIKLKSLIEPQINLLKIHANLIQQQAQQTQLAAQYNSYLLHTLHQSP